VCVCLLIILAGSRNSSIRSYSWLLASPPVSPSYSLCMAMELSSLDYRPKNWSTNRLPVGRVYSDSLYTTRITCLLQLQTSYIVKWITGRYADRALLIL